MLLELPVVDALSILAYLHRQRMCFILPAKAFQKDRPDSHERKTYARSA
jgi:hypothetical protein